MLRQAGHDVATVAEQGLESTADSDLIAICYAEARCLVTLDLDAIQSGWIHWHRGSEASC